MSAVELQIIDFIIQTSNAIVTPDYSQFWLKKTFTRLTVDMS